MVQWLRLWAPNAGGPGWIPGQGTRSHMLQLKFVHAATNSQCSQIKNKYIFFKKVALWQRTLDFPGAQWLRICCQCRGHGFYPWSGMIPHAEGQLSLCTTTTEAHTPWNLGFATRKATTRRSHCDTTREALAPRNWRKPARSNRDPVQPKINAHIHRNVSIKFKKDYLERKKEHWLLSTLCIFSTLKSKTIFIEFGDNITTVSKRIIFKFLISPQIHIQMVRLQSNWVGNGKDSFPCEFHFPSTLIFLVRFSRTRKELKEDVL